MSHKSRAQRAFSGSAAGQDIPFAHLAKVGVAGSNPVVRSGKPHKLRIPVHFRPSLLSLRDGVCSANWLPAEDPTAHDP